MHKKHLDARLITAGTAWITNPIACIIAAMLQPILNGMSSVAKKSEDVLEDLGKSRFTSKSALAAFDVEKLYPSMRHNVLKCAIRRVLVEYFSTNPCHMWGLVVEMLLDFVDIVLVSQVVSFRFGNSVNTVYFVQILGISMGLSCAVQLANMFLLGMDRLVIAACGNMLYNYKRFVDDVLIHVDRSQSELLLALFNSFDDCIIVTCDDEPGATNVHFLDLDLDIAHNALSYKTYRKPQCSYSYTPFNSNHSRSTLIGIVHTELHRIYRTCSTEQAFVHQCQFFIGKLKLRGYPVEITKNIFEKFRFQHRYNFSKNVTRAQTPRPKQDQCLIVPFKVQFSPGAHALGFNAIVRNHSSCLGSVGSSLRFVSCYLSAKNLFRERYNRFL